jgi:hypothetical protein
MAFDALKHPAAFIDPTYLSDRSAWVGHIPFAAALMAMARPRTFVELGTLKGDSYCAFCQAVVELKLDTQCTAIDTWRGDPHAGSFGDEFLGELRAFHDPRYTGFSRLLQSDFDSAASQFEPGSIDLLHIDGLHTYEAVRHDFETWLSRLSDRGIILFHDTALRAEDFGVWRLWNELSGRFPSFAFEHENGLGVLGVGTNLPDAVRQFLADANEQPQLVRRYFATLGGRVTIGRDLVIARRIFDEQRKVLDDWKRRTNQPLDERPVLSFAAYAIRILRDTEAMAAASIKGA